MKLLTHKKLIAWLAVLALAVSLPAAALADADTTPPTVSLYSPSGLQVAATGRQKIIFLSSDEKVSGASGKNVTLSDSTKTYTASATTGDVIGGALGPWYVVYDLSDFSDGTTSPTSLAVSTEYTVSADAGAFADTAGNPSAAISTKFTTVADGSQFSVVFTKSDAGQTVTAGGSAIVSGQAVASDVTVVVTVPDVSGYSFQKDVKVNGTTETPDLSNYSIAGNLEVYITRASTALSGTPVISGNAYYGGTLSADLSGINQTDLSEITLKWIQVDGTNEATLVTGDKDTTWTLTETDIGKTIRLEVTDATLTGTLNATTAAITKAPYSGGSVTKPAAQTVGETSIVLTSVSGYEYMVSGGSWQDSTTFSGLTAGTNYDFYQRVKATATVQASATSEKTTVKTTAGLTGTAVITGTAQFGQTLTGSLSGSNASGTITYTWQRGGSNVGTGTTYPLGSADVGQVITLVVTASDQTGSLSITTTAVTKAYNTTTPAAPTINSATATSITLNAISGYQYSLGGTYWQDTTTFHSLVAGATYTFYQRVAETTTAFASAPSAGANLSTLPVLSGTISTTGEARYGITMTATLTGSNNTGTLTYTWKRGSTVAGTGTVYAVSAADIGNQLSVEVTSSVQGGTVTRSFGTVAKAYFIGDAPDAPTRSSRTTSKIVLKAVDGCEYSRGGTTWQDSTTFSGLKSDTSYTFYQRYKATATMEASPASDAYKTSTVASSSSDDDSDTSATPTPTPSTTDSATTALYSYTLTADNTRILYSTMKSLAEGNKTQDVTIKQDDVEFTFPKGTMTQSYTQLWYDFGATINNSIAAQTAQEIAGDAYVATVHYNYNGELPGTANIRLNVGVAQAGKTLYYYLLNDDETLTFQQTATVDSTGWATVSQTHCSDYVFLNRDINTASASPSPSPEGSASPLPSPTVSPSTSSGGLGSDGWFIAAIILIAVALIVGGIWLYTKNKEDRMSDDDDDDMDDTNLF